MEDQTPQHDTTTNPIHDGSPASEVISAGQSSETPTIPAISGEVEENVEEKEIEAVKTQYKLTPKFNKWCELFFDKSKDSPTYLNKTKSAITAYNLDPVKQYFVASKIGQQNYQKLSNVASEIAENKGYNFEKWLDVGWLNALRSQSPEWWDRMGDVLKFRDLKPTVINNTQNNTQINISEPDQVNFNSQFKKFIEAT